MPLVHVETVHRHAPAGTPFALDAPDDSDALPGFVLIVRGRLLASRGGETLVARCQDRTVASAAPLPAGSGGARPFTLYVNTLELDLAFDLRILAEDARGRVPLADIRGRRRPLRGGGERRFRPLLIHRVPPSGATWLALLLAGHPGLVAYRPERFDSRHALYWAEILRTLTRPASAYQTLAGDPRTPRWWLGDRPPRTELGLPGPDVWAWLTGEGLEDLAGLFAGRIEAFYAVAARESGKPHASRFVEKAGSPPTTRILRELFPGLREILLVRDPRDVLAARRAAAPSGDDETLLERVTEEYHGLLQAADAAGSEALVVRHEALAQDPAGAAAGVLRALGLDVSPEDAAGLLGRAAEIREGLPRARRDALPGEQGRWRRDLPPALAARCSGAFGAFLERFGCL